MALKLGKRWTRLNLEKFEDRVNPDASFGWELVAASSPTPPTGVQPGLYFRIDGDTSGQAIADTVTVQNDTAGGFFAQINTTSADDGAALAYFLGVSAGEIALARQAFAVGGVQPAFRGVHVLTYDGNDTAGGGGLPYAMWIEGGAGNDDLSGGNVADRIDGGVGGPVGSPGNDTISGSSGSDTLVGNDGDDSITGGTGNDTVLAGTGNDTVSGGSGNDNIDVDGGNNLVNAGDGNDTVTAGSGTDTLNGDAGADLINAGDGNDTVTGGTGADTLNGEGGNDTINGNDDNDTISGGTGNDTLNGDAGNDTITGDDGNDTITGGAGADNLSGGNDNDVVNADTDDTALNGGPGTDTLNLSGNGTLSPAIDLGNIGFETVNIVAGSNPTIVFAPPTSAFSGTPPNYSGLLNAGDTLDFRNAPSGQFIDMNNLPFSLGSTSGVTNVNGSPFNDTITGTGAADTIDGSGGDDVISSGLGNDTVTGGAGNDFVGGGDGDDRLTGGAGNDTVLGGNGDDSFVIEWNGGALNANDVFLGQGGFDTLIFQGVPDDNLAAAGLQQSAANLAIIYNYIAAQNMAGKMDWNNGPSADNPTIQFI